MTPAKRKPILGRVHPAHDPLGFGTPLAVPALYDGYVRRPDLVKRLREAKDYPLVLLTAPAGYAKTSMLAEWADQDDRPFAWVNLDSRDDDATRLLNRLVEAVDGVSLKGRPFVLVVDNAHVLRTTGALDALANTIASLRPDGQVAMASRRELRLPLGRMRAGREVFELTRRDLAMSRSDSAALLRCDRPRSPPGGGRNALRPDGGLARGALSRWTIPGPGAGRGRRCRRCTLRRRRPIRVRLFQGRVPGRDVCRADQVPDSLVRPRDPHRTELRRGARAVRISPGAAGAGPREPAAGAARSQRRFLPLPAALQADAALRAAPSRARRRRRGSTAEPAPGTRTASSSRKPSITRSRRAIRRGQQN